MKTVFLSVFLALSLILLLSHVSDATISCGEVSAKAAPCVMFTTGKAPKVATQCCTNLQALAAMVKSVPDKKAACNCLKKSGKNLGIQDKFLSQLPTLCKINVGFPISSNTNCEAIH